jgi:acetoin:2,6-dichlorophenolindophenol oxidoreductase subunit alpha
MVLRDVYEGAAEAIARARTGGGPSLIVADTYRYLGHMAGDTQIYRSAAEVEKWKSADPIEQLANELRDAGVLTDALLDEIRVGATQIVQDAENFARASSYPEVSLAYDDVYATMEAS